MSRKIKALLAIIAFIHVSTVLARDVSDLRVDIRTTYDFEPSRMTFSEQASRAPELSKLWDRYDASPESYRLALRSELQSATNRELLYCDGGMLLLAKSNSSEDIQLGLASLSKCSLAEIQHTPYFYTLHRLAVRGVETFDLQVRILSKPKYSVFIVPHALTLGQDYAFLYPLLVVNESTYVPRLISLLVNTTDSTAQKSIIRALWYAATAQSEEAIKLASEDSRLGESTRADAHKMLQYLATVRGWKDDDSKLARMRKLVGTAPSAGEDELRSKRRARMRSVSDEALYELDAYTGLIYRLRRGT